VPERRDVAAPRTIRLWVAVIHVPGAAPGALPGIFLSGGPGAASSTPFVAGNVTIVGAPTDLVVLDQRGRGRSEPHLACPGLDAPLNATHSWAERLAQARSAAEQCRAAFVQQGIDLDGYNTVETAADVVDLRTALGYRRWTVSGLSYGGRVAREVYRQDPTGVAGLVLDSTVTTAPAGPADLVQRADRSLRIVTIACAAQPACVGRHGDFEANLATTAARLDLHPHLVPAANGVAGRSFTGADLYAGGFLAAERTDLIPLLPTLAASLAGGDDSVLDAMATQLADPPAADPHDAFATGLQDVTMCADDEASFTDADRQVLSDPGRWSNLVLTWGWAVCDAWKIDALPQHQLASVAGTVPVLAVLGQMDPITGPATIDEIRSQFPAAVIAVYPGGGHGVQFMNGCATAIAVAFLAEPAGHIDTSCMATMAPPFVAG
jgi:pimeloyl-ACP methyl ester carboxylesterase